MTQNTEQNVRTVREQDGQVQEMHADMVKAVCGRRSDYPEDVFRAYLKRHIVQAEARGAEEQRRKDGEETQHLWDHLATINNYGFQFDPEKDDPKKLADACIKTAREAIENPPANVAALEARIAELKEAEQLARADAKASKARVKALEEAFGPLLSVCEAEMIGDATADCTDEEGVSTSLSDDGTLHDSPITFGHLRRARAALTREGGV